MIHNFSQVKCVFREKKAHFFGIKQSTSDLVQTYKTCFLQNFAANFLLFWLFSTKNAEHNYFNHYLECAAPKRWSKYTTVKHPNTSQNIQHLASFLFTLRLFGRVQRSSLQPRTQEDRRLCWKNRHTQSSLLGESTKNMK